MHREFKGTVNLKPLPVGKWLEFKPHFHLRVKVWWLLYVPPSLLFSVVAFFSVQHVYALFNIITINSEYFPKQHELGLVTPGFGKF